MRAVLLIAAAVLLTGCTSPPRTDVAIVRQCGMVRVWQDDKGHRWIGLNYGGGDLDRVADGADLRDLCPEDK